MYIYFDLLVKIKTNKDVEYEYICPNNQPHNHLPNSSYAVIKDDFELFSDRFAFTKQELGNDTTWYSYSFPIEITLYGPSFIHMEVGYDMFIGDFLWLCSDIWLWSTDSIKS
jgi:hypothetical protein